MKRKNTIIRRKTAHIISLILFVSLFCTNLNAQTNIVIGETYNFTQEPSSTIDYQIDISSPAEVTIHIDNWISTLNWEVDYDRLYVYNSDNNPVDRNLFSSEEDPFLFHMFQNSDLIFNIGQAGTYTISVHSGAKWGWGGASIQNYEMLVTAIYCDDTNEPNETISSATPIDIGSTISAYQWKQINTSEIWGDVDCYSVNVNTPGILKIELIDWVGVLNWSLDFDRLFVYNSDGESIGLTDGYDFYSWMMGGGTIEDPEVIEMNLTHAGTYILKFYSGAGTSLTPYHFSTSFLAVDDVFEPNDELSNAKIIPSSEVWYQAYEWRSIGNTMSVSADEDFYYFFAADAGEYSLTLDGWISILNWSADYDRLYIYDADGNSVGDSPYDWMLGSSPIIFNLPSSGKYYLQLHCGNAYSSEGYKFKLSGSVDGIQNINKPALKFQLYPNPASDIVSLDFNQKMGKELTLNIYNVTGELMYSEIIKQNRTQINLENLSNGAYWIEVKSNEGSAKQMLIIQ